KHRRPLHPVGSIAPWAAAAAACQIEGPPIMADERFASIDIGSNSVKLLIAERRSDGAFVPVSETVYITRLGEGFHAHRLGEPAIRRTLDAIRDFTRLCAEFGVMGIAAVGTSAL